MRTIFRKIDQIVNPVSFQKIQDDMALATDLAIITVDYLGKPLTNHSNCSEYCKKVRSSKYGMYCEKCDSHGGLEAARIRKPYIYTCHAGLIDFAIPIIVNEMYLGAFMAGQVLLSKDDVKDQPERILPSVTNSIASTIPNLKDSYDILPVMKMEKIISLANMLIHIGNYCIKEAELKEMISHRSRNRENDFSDIKSISKHIRKDSELIIQPALNFIRKNPKEKITLEMMADLCNISSSYFSKLFAKENLGSLSNYINEIRIENAKELLTSTNWSIQTIAANLGYDDCGYFIKVFKKYTKKTPLEFKNTSVREVI